MGTSPPQQCTSTDPSSGSHLSMTKWNQLTPQKGTQEGGKESAEISMGHFTSVGHCWGRHSPAELPAGLGPSLPQIFTVKMLQTLCFKSLSPFALCRDMIVFLFPHHPPCALKLWDVSPSTTNPLCEMSYLKPTQSMRRTLWSWPHCLQKKLMTLNIALPPCRDCSRVVMCALSSADIPR